MSSSNGFGDAFQLGLDLERVFHLLALVDEGGEAVADFFGVIEADLQVAHLLGDVLRLDLAGGHFAHGFDGGEGIFKLGGGDADGDGVTGEFLEIAAARLGGGADGLLGAGDVGDGHGEQRGVDDQALGGGAGLGGCGNVRLEGGRGGGGRGQRGGGRGVNGKGAGGETPQAFAAGVESRRFTGGQRQKQEGNKQGVKAHKVLRK